MPKTNKVMITEGESQNTMFVQCVKSSEPKSIANKRAYQMWIRLHNKKCDCLKNQPLDKTEVHDVAYDQYYKTGRRTANPDDVEW